MAGKKFVTNAVLLTATSTALRVVGMMYRVYLSSKIGESGMGLHQLVQSVYMLCVTFATAGVSVAVTRLISEQNVTGNAENMRKIMRFSTGWSATISSMISLLLLVSAPGIAGTLLGDEALTPCLRILAVSLPFMACASCFSGYFLARSRVIDSCLAQVVEQIVRISLVAAIIDRYVQSGVEQGCFAVFIGNCASEIVACFVLFLFYKIDIRRVPCVSTAKLGGNIFSRFMPIALPIAGGKYLSSGLHAVENLLVPIQIERFTHDRNLSLAQFGALKGMALPILMFPSSFLTTIATLLIPEMTAAYALRKHGTIEKLTRKVLLITFVFAIFIGGVFFRFADSIGMLLYNSQTASLIIKWLAPVVPFMYIDCIADGLLKGLGQQMSCLKYNTVDSLSRIALIFVLLPIRGIYGFLTVMIISNTMISVLELFRLLKVSECKFPFVRCVLLPLGGVVSAHILSSLLLKNTARWSTLLTGGVVYCIIYFIFLRITGAFSLKDLKTKI